MLVISGSTGYTNCTESFIFSLVNPSGAGPTKLPLKGTSNGNGIYCNSGYGPTFGGNHDLYISSEAHANSNSYSNVNHTYQCPPGGAATTFLTGNSNFVANELEVFVCQAT